MPAWAVQLIIASAPQIIAGAVDIATYVAQMIHDAGAGKQPTTDTWEGLITLYAKKTADDYAKDAAIKAAAVPAPVVVTVPQSVS